MGFGNFQMLEEQRKENKPRLTQGSYGRMTQKSEELIGGENNLHILNFRFHSLGSGLG